MALTRSFRETVAKRAQHDEEFRLALFEEAIQAVLEGDLADAKSLLRDCINATVGFDALSVAVGIPSKSLMRMVGPQGNPTLRNFSLIVSTIQQRMELRAQAQVYSVSSDPALPIIASEATSQSALGGEAQAAF